MKYFWYICRVIEHETGDTAHMNVFDTREDALNYVLEWQKRDNVLYDFYIKKCEVDDGETADVCNK